MPEVPISSRIRIIRIKNSALLISALLLLLWCAFPHFLISGDYFSFSKQKASDRELNNKDNDLSLIESAIIYFTNLERKKYNLPPCLSDDNLKLAAFRHSAEMARLQYFSHHSPVAKNRELLDRLKRTNFTMSNIIVAENIGVDYLLRIAKRPFYTSCRHGKLCYIDAKTHQPIGFQTHIEFARNMVQHWMKSPPHKKNILNSKYKLMGVGIARGLYQDVQALYVTQNFSGPLADENAIHNK